MAETAPDHWQCITGPANWFCLRHPPRWTAEESDGAYALRPPDTDTLIAINTIWMNPDVPGELPGLQDIISQFPRVRNVQPAPDPQLEHLLECSQGEAILDQHHSWWGRLWKPEQWRAWKMWAFRQGSLMIVVTLLHEDERDRELESIVRLVLRCLEISDTPADPPEVFAERTLSLARRKFPLLSVDLLEEFQLQIEMSRLNLINFYRAYLRDPARFEQILLPAITTAVQVQGWGEQETSPPLEVVRERLMPMLYPEDVWRERFPDILGQPWVAGLVILYVVDEASAYWYVRQELADRWQLPIQEVHEIALDNLQSYFERQPMEVTVASSEEGAPSIMMPDKPDSYNTSRLLCHTFLQQLRQVAAGDLAIGIPGRDFFVAVSTRLPPTIERIRKRVQEDFQQTDHPLTDRILLVTADGVSELIDDHAQG